MWVAKKYLVPILSPVTNKLLLLNRSKSIIFVPAQDFTMRKVTCVYLGHLWCFNYAMFTTAESSILHITYNSKDFDSSYDQVI